ncbi:MAG: exodeoxyribonuclease VII small subunit, partial [Planctomycetota bacterium]|nr:exodeoxyribonuclease VII small subunit [Planctomycetota bacterium]
EAIDRIERIVAALERGESNLTDALAGFEEGVRLLNR